jgi:hypothetical protein
MQMPMAIAITKQCAFFFRIAAKTRTSGLLDAGKENRTRFFHFAPSRGRMPALGE